MAPHARPGRCVPALRLLACALLAAGLAAPPVARGDDAPVTSAGVCAPAAALPPRCCHLRGRRRALCVTRSVRAPVTRTLGPACCCTAAAAWQACSLTPSDAPHGAPRALSACARQAPAPARRRHPQMRPLRTRRRLRPRCCRCRLAPTTAHSAATGASVPAAPRPPAAGARLPGAMTGCCFRTPGPTCFCPQTPPARRAPVLSPRKRARCVPGPAVPRIPLPRRLSRLLRPRVLHNPMVRGQVLGACVLFGPQGVLPLNGPTSGGYVVTLTGEYFGASASAPGVQARVGATACTVSLLQEGTGGY